MHPIFLQWGHLTIYWYGVMAAIGYGSVIVYFSYMEKRDRWPSGFGSNLAFLMMIAGILGARIAYILANWSYFSANPIEMIRIDQGGLIFYGGLILGLISAVLYARHYKLSLYALGDFVLCGLPLGHAFGRIGCFLNGCCYGSECRLPWAVHMHNGLRHPVQLYESGANFLLFAFLAWYYPRNKRSGTVAAMYLVIYALIRFVDEFIRGDERLRWMGLSLAQWISVVMLSLAVFIWFSRPQGRLRPAE